MTIESQIMIRVGRIKNSSDKLLYPGFVPIVVMTKSSKYGSLSPYCLQNKDGQIMENIWQFSKVYRKVPASKQYYSRWDKKVIWDHPAEVHIDAQDQITPEYLTWRKKGMNNPYPVRWPVGQNWVKNCIGAIPPGELDKSSDTSRDIELLDYVDSRKNIYLPIYSELVRKQSQYGELLRMLRSGTNLLILEVDGPHSESAKYYADRYGLDIDGGTMLCTKSNLEIMINDTKHNFGHGYCLAWTLLDSI